jgi:small redox-active disulfide protein 2
MLKIEVLGPGCPKCRLLEENVRAAVEEMGIEAEVTKISEVKEIAARGVFMTPGLVVNGRVVSSGHSLNVAQVKNRLDGLAEP